MKARLIKLIQRLRPINKSPIIVLGNAKSGTTAITALLGLATGKTTQIDINGLYDANTKKELHNGALTFAKFVKSNHQDFTKDIIKEASMTYIYHHVAQYFNSAQYVFIIRDPRDNIRSILNRLKIAGNLDQLTEKDKSNIGGNRPAWELMLDGRWMGIPYAHYIEAMAGRWNIAAKTYLENRGHMALIKYEDFLANKTGAIYKLADSLNLKVTHDISDKVDKQYQPKGDTHVSWDVFFGKANQQRIERICRINMAELGYEV